MNESVKQVADQLEQGCAAFTDEALVSIQRAANARARHRQLVLGSLVVAFVLLVAGAMVATRNGGDDTEAVSVVAQPATSSTLADADTTLGPDQGSSNKTVNTDFSEGWTAVHVGAPELDFGWVPAALMAAPTISAGDLIETYAPDGHLIGYYVRAAGFVPLAEFDAPGFDWQDFIRAANPDDPDFADRAIADIKADGGLGEIQTAEMAGVG